MVQFVSGVAVADDETANDPSVDPYTLLHEKVPALSSLNKENVANFMSLAAAGTRAIETSKDDGYLNDIYAEALAGEFSKAFMQTFGIGNDVESMAYCVLRHRVMDDEIEENLNPDIHQVVFVGAGMDSRPYRLQRFVDCHVFELDSCQELAEYKQRVLKEMHAKLIPKAHDVIISDLSKSTWPDALIAHGFDLTKPTLWISEAVLPYLDEDSVNRLFTTIDSMSAPNSQVLTDMLGTGSVHMDLVVVNGQFTWHVGTLEHIHEGGVLRALPWKIEYLLRRTGDGEYSGRHWDPVKFARYFLPKDQVKIGPWFIASCIKPSS